MLRGPQALPLTLPRVLLVLDSDAQMTYRNLHQRLRLGSVWKLLWPPMAQLRWPYTLSPC